MKFTLLAATAFVAGALAAPYSPAPPAYDNKKCDSVKKSYLDCQKLQDKDYSQWQTCKSNEDKQKKEYDLCISIQYKFEGSYKQCTKSEQDEKKHYDECKAEEDKWAKTWDECESNQKPSYKKKWDAAKYASKKAYNAWKAYDCEQKKNIWEGQITKCTGEYKQWQDAKKESEKQEDEHKNQVKICKVKKISWDSCQKKDVEKPAKKPAGYPASY